MDQIELKIMEIMDNIEYGWLDKNHVKHVDVDKKFSLNYILQSPEELLVNKLGVCWDQVELERYLFENYNIKVKTFFLVHYDGDKCPTHTFLIFEKDNKFFWFEHAWELFKGIHYYDNLDKLLKDVIEKFIKVELNNVYEKENLYLYEYSKPNFNISVQEFYKHCEEGKNIKINN